MIPNGPVSCASAQQTTASPAAVELLNDLDKTHMVWKGGGGFAEGERGMLADMCPGFGGLNGHEGQQ